MRRQATSARREHRHQEERAQYLRLRLAQLAARQQAGYTTSDKGGKLEEIIPVFERELVVLLGQNSLFTA